MSIFAKHPRNPDLIVMGDHNYLIFGRSLISCKFALDSTGVIWSTYAYVIELNPFTLNIRRLAFDSTDTIVSASHKSLIYA